MSSGAIKERPSQLSSEVAAFLSEKSQLDHDSGFEPLWIPDFLFDFQAHLDEWSIRKGRAAIFANCGLGKTPMQLVWAENVVRKTNLPVLIVTPLAVSAQTIEEAKKFGLEAVISRDGTAKRGIIVTNYERLHYFNWQDFGGMVCDESSAIKNFSGKHRALVTEFMRKLPYRLLCTATAAPNDYPELGTSSEALGYLGYQDMLNEFFKKLDGFVRVEKRGSGKYRFKGHAEQRFWRWIGSWARSIRRPSDLGFTDDRFALPALTEEEHLVRAKTMAPGMLFEMPPVDIQGEREEQRRTLRERCEKAAQLADTDKPVVLWCNLNPEGDLLERLIPDAIQVKGSTPIQEKEEALIGFSKGAFRVLVTKDRIGGWGMNWAHCAHTIRFPGHSYEAYYQSVRRFWRFGQLNPVKVDIVTTEGGHDVMANLKRKAAQADRMFTALVAHMQDAMAISRKREYNTEVRLPAWLSSNRK